MAKPLRITIAASAATCHARFADPNSLPTWVAGIRSAEVLRRDPKGMPTEIEFEFVYPDGMVHRYTLLYAYGENPLRVAWSPGQHAGHHVRGMATFEPRGEHCEMSYSLERDDEPEPQTIEQARTILASFKKFVEATSASTR